MTIPSEHTDSGVERSGSSADIQPTHPSLEVSDSYKERRRGERVSTSIQLRLRKFEPMPWRTGVCVDISDGGLGLQTLEPLKIGELVEVELLGPDGVVHVCGRVVYRYAHRYGLSLLGLSRLQP